ncbi:hypothetical protein [Prosthecomicrobium pneumaticum]|uniref:Uncharacterized protein n=1 Tax=Prosthecomicrobium pneumaticum TaxID=81895 RepID=A0A7W9FPX4_9HYPH|nr:hypothetical protein [Prosthecomicrobium pneumaticum]MBB5754635.1 hypothetical protein [Prosthecomicrobium pneumaticum]
MATVAHTTPARRRPEDAATLALMLLKASLGLDGSAAPVRSDPAPVLAGGAAERIAEAA